MSIQFSINFDSINQLVHSCAPNFGKFSFIHSILQKFLVFDLFIDSLFQNWNFGFWNGRDGWFDNWGGCHAHTDSVVLANTLLRILYWNASVCWGVVSTNSIVNLVFYIIDWFCLFCWSFIRRWICTCIMEEQHLDLWMVPMQMIVVGMHLKLPVMITVYASFKDRKKTVSFSFKDSDLFLIIFLRVLTIWVVFFWNRCSN